MGRVGGSWVVGRGWMGSWILDPGSCCGFSAVSETVLRKRMKRVEIYCNSERSKRGSVTIIENQERNHSEICLLNSIAVIS